MENDFNPQEDPRRYTVSSFRLLSRFLGINTPWIVSGYSEDNTNINHRTFVINISHEKVDGPDVLSEYILWKGVKRKLARYEIQTFDFGYHFNLKFFVEVEQPVFKWYKGDKIISPPSIIREQAEILNTIQKFAN